MNLLHRAVFAIRHAMTNEESRFAVGHMKITENEAQATNGQIALRVQLNGLDNDCFPSASPGLKAIKPVAEDVEEIRVSKQTADKLFKALPKNGPLPVLQNAYIGQDGEKPVIAVTDLDSSQVFRTEEGGTFPNLDGLNKEEAPKTSVCIDAFYLNEMCKVLRDFQGLKQGDCPIIFECWDKETAIVMSARNDTGQKLKGYLMPMAFEAEEFRFLTQAQLDKEKEERAKEIVEAKEILEGGEAKTLTVDMLNGAKAEPAPDPDAEQVSTYIVPADAPEGTEIIAEEDKEDYVVSPPSPGHIAKIMEDE